MKKYNRADKVLIVAAILFIAALYIKVQYPNNIFVQGVLFCVEAALVGGIADWFAVKALFGRPLGISWHTAILPRKRQAFTQATTKLVQQQFFSRKNIFLQLRSLNAVDKIIVWADKEEYKEIAADKIIDTVKTEIKRSTTEEFINEYIVKIITENISATEIKIYLSEWLQKPQLQQQILHKVLLVAGNKIAQPESRQYIEKILDEKMKSNVPSFLFSLGSMLDVINTAECAVLVQKKLIDFLQEMMQSESQVHQDISLIIANNIDELTKKDAYDNIVVQLQTAIAETDVVRKIIREWTNNVCSDFDLNEEQSRLQRQLRSFIKQQFDDVFILLKENIYLRKQLEKFINDVIGRSALQGQNMIGDIVRRVLMNMSDAQLNEIVYSKISTDLIWIRVNGSLVGGSIGLLIFIIAQMLK
ncbi:DUF445 domain-containing protein [Pectinatus brassicae]|uniref:Uncharacterized membrane-anchored protein YjiN (DUF445 family) n=1 Tax=Pectinatus brassicae TaxID=862415 RepID=A0A840USS4_9FIRM|nr:DUF445 domain-containing protein [Pectinatus brassicae]MBB5335864.1 uncharacterized membrane-anchored protein YjiN (DUF445 family) [Pectinatus brassicae]